MMTEASMMRVEALRLAIAYCEKHPAANVVATASEFLRFLVDELASRDVLT